MSEESVDPRTFTSLMQHPRRALLLECLLEHDEPVSLPDLADEVAIREHDRDLTGIEAEVVRDIYLSLYHTHVPKLAEVGLVEYDQSADLVTAATNVDIDPTDVSNV